jgi:hypothetical protein
MRKSGWGGRIRTYEWRDQNPLPYHLATPHHKQSLRRAMPEAARHSFRGPPYRAMAQGLS